jgi:hypothetical protein
MAKSGYKNHYDTIEIEDEENGLMYEFDVYVRVFIQQPWGGSPHTCDNPYDYYGYTEIEEWEIDGVVCFDEDGNELECSESDIPMQVIDVLETAINELEFEE